MSVSSASPSATAQKVFISYRRKDTAAYAGWLYERMVARFGENNIFMDLEMPPGIDFHERITEVVSGCVVLLIMIGPGWAEATEEDGTRRLDNPGDFVRLEIETGLARPEVTPIPVLVGGARMPKREDLPPQIQAIARRNAIELSDGRWSYDVGRLADALAHLLPDAKPTPREEPSPTPAPRETIPLGWRMPLEGMAVAAVTAIPARLLGELLPTSGGSQVDESGREIAENVGSLVLRRTETLALVGAALAFWLARRLWGTDPIRNLARGLVTGGLAGMLGGLVLGLGVYLPERVPTFEDRAQIDLLALALTGGVLGSLVGHLWRPRRSGLGFLAGAAGGFLFQFLFVVATGWKNTEKWELAISFGIAAAAIAGAALAAMLLADRREDRTGLEQGPS